MNKNCLNFTLGLLLLVSACDPMSQETVSPITDEATLAENESDPNARVGYDLKINKKMFQIYSLTELAYAGIGDEEAIKEAKLFVRKTGKDEFLVEMIKKSVKHYDNIVLKRGVFMSEEAKNNHARMAGGEHEFEYDILAGYEEASVDFFIEIPGIPGESEDTKYELVKTFGSAASSGKCIYPFCGGWATNKPQLVAMSDFLETLLVRYASDPDALDEAAKQLEINSGVDPVAIGLLLPAIQKVREAAARSSRESDDPAKKLLQSLGLDEVETFGTFLQAGGVGAMDKFVFGTYDLGEDLDWAAIQLHRAKFEMEMFYLWEAFWEENQSDPIPGR